MGDTTSDSKRKSGSGRGNSVVRALAKKLLMPLVATATSAVAAYAVKHGSQLMQDQVLPRLREAATGAGDVAEGAVDRAKSAGGTVGTAAGDVAERAKSVVSTSDGASSDGSSDGPARRAGARMPISNDERERRWKQRAEARAARRKTPAK